MCMMPPTLHNASYEPPDAQPSVLRDRRFVQSRTTYGPRREALTGAHERFGEALSINWADNTNAFLSKVLTDNLGLAQNLGDVSSPLRAIPKDGSKNLR